MSPLASFSRIFIPLRKPSCPVFRLTHFARTTSSGRNRCLTTSQRCFAKEPEETCLKYLYVNTSLDLWEECPHGLTFDVGYVDSHSAAEASDKMPVIVGLPGILETHEDLSDLLLPFGKLGYRIVIPNFPGNKNTKGVTQPDEDIFTYSIEERSAFVRDFLDELGVNRIDMLVTSHCSVYPGLQLTMQDPHKYRSLVMINPAGVRPSRIMQPTSVHKRFTKLWDSPVLRVFLKGAILLVRPFTSFKGWNLRKVVTFSRSVAGTSYDEVKDLIDNANMYKRQGFVIYSDSDKLFEREISEEFVDRLGIPVPSIHVIRDDDQSKSNEDSNQSASSVKRSAIDINRIQCAKFEGVKGDILTVKASVIKKLLWDYMKTVSPGS